MRSRQTALTALLVACGLTVMVNNASADSLPFAPGNLLGGLAAVSSSELANYSADNVTDGLQGGENMDLVFGDGDGDQRLLVHGFNSAVSTIRLWSFVHGPKHVTIRSSLDDVTSLPVPVGTQTLAEAEAAAFSTLLVNNASVTAWSANAGYLEFAVIAPTGTHSLFFDFDGGNTYNGSTGFARIAEIQAFIPEPSSIVLVAIGTISLLAYAWRKRK